MESRATRIALGVWVALVLAFLYIPIAVICLYAFNQSNVQLWIVFDVNGSTVHTEETNSAASAAT